MIIYFLKIMISVKKTLSFGASLLLLGTAMVFASQVKALSYEELASGGKVMGETTYFPVNPPPQTKKS